jgi:cholesterol transport system auxiliary component
MSCFNPPNITLTLSTLGRLVRQRKRLHILALGLVVGLTTLSGCSALRPTTTPHPVFYSLDESLPAATPGFAGPATGQTLIVNVPHASAGFDSPRIMYLREPFKLAYFAQSEWVDTPARMLGPLLVNSIAKAGGFRAVALTSATASGDLRLDTEIIRMQHEFLSQPSQVRFTLRAYLIDDKTRRVVAWREFDASIASTSEDTYGGVVAANVAVQTVLKDMSVFLAERPK